MENRIQLTQNERRGGSLVRGEFFQVYSAAHEKQGAPRIRRLVDVHVEKRHGDIAVVRGVDGL